MPGAVLIAVSYVLLTVFAVAFLVRSVRMAKLPVHLRWELAPVPHEKGRSRYGGSYLEEFEWWTKPREKSLVNELVYMFLEIVFLKSVWEHNRRMWWFSFPFHFGMYLLIVAAAVLSLNGILELAGVSFSAWSIVRGGTLALTGLGFVLGGIGAAGLLAGRLWDPKLKDFTAPAALFNLAILLAVFASGVGALATSEYFSGVSNFVGALLTANGAIQVPAVLAVHLTLTLIFMAYLPFSQMMHFVAKYFTYHQVRWDDEPLVPGGHLEKQVLGLLNQPVTWSAEHLNADGKKNWVDIATEEAEK